jgi:glyoxalase superfamily protein
MCPVTEVEAMVVRVAQWTVDVEDVDLMARFWSEVLGYTVEKGDDGSAKLYPPPDGSTEAPTVWLQGSGTPERGKNRLHLDVVSDGDAQAEVRRLLRLGAQPWR